MGHDVFISYSSKDRKAATELCRALESGLVRVWMAPRDLAPGSTWAMAIPTAIEGSRLVILVFSKDADMSEWVPREIQHALNCKKRIITIRLSAVEPAFGLRLYVNTLHWIDAFPGPLHLHLPGITRQSQDLLEIRREAKPEARFVRKPLPPPPAPPAPDAALPIWRRPWSGPALAALGILAVLVAWGAVRVLAPEAPAAVVATSSQDAAPNPLRGFASVGDCSSGGEGPLIESSTRDFELPDNDEPAGTYTVIDVSTLKIRDKVIKLSGVGKGDARGVERLRGWLEMMGPTVSCRPADTRSCRYNCEVGGADISQKILSSTWALPATVTVNSEN